MVNAAFLKPYIRASIEAVANALMDAEAAVIVNAAHYERSDTRTVYRNGYRTRRWHTHSGIVVLHIPKLRSGSYYPAFLDDTDTAENVFSYLVQQALTGDLSHADICPLLLDPTDHALADEILTVVMNSAHHYLSRRLRYPYPVLVVQRQGEHVYIYGERSTGKQSLLDVRAFKHSDAYWQAVLRDLKNRGLTGVEVLCGDETTDVIWQIAYNIFPTMENHTTTPQHIIAALGIPMERPAMDRSQPVAILTSQTDAVRTISISDKAFAYVRRFMQDKRDAIGEPLRRVA